jgi:hypothetical protein
MMKLFRTSNTPKFSNTKKYYSGFIGILSNTDSPTLLTHFEYNVIEFNCFLVLDFLYLKKKLKSL